ncbi:hypothetical protein D5S18_34235 [Nocardia panacis]|uniref:Uncharacterized protein n=2 Tax=Nocardia panacis TaxID=2340916 RepID=A0A3A4K580_9NOCA|nr:hypothetical protein D5S18_34235 [Nocardia panacis]
MRGRTVKQRRAGRLPDETLSERFERLYDRDVDDELRMRRLVRMRRNSRHDDMRSGRDVGLRKHRASGTVDQGNSKESVR